MKEYKRLNLSKQEISILQMDCIMNVLYSLFGDMNGEFTKVPEKIIKRLIKKIEEL
jgi:hypothetical protein